MKRMEYGEILRVMFRAEYLVAILSDVSIFAVFKALGVRVLQRGPCPGICQGVETSR